MDFLDSADIFVFHQYDLILKVLCFSSAMRSEVISLKICSESKHITSTSQKRCSSLMEVDAY